MFAIESTFSTKQKNTNPMSASPQVVQPVSPNIFVGWVSVSVTHRSASKSRISLARPLANESLNFGISFDINFTFTGRTTPGLWMSQFLIKKLNRDTVDFDRFDVVFEFVFDLRPCQTMQFAIHKLCWSLFDRLIDGGRNLGKLFWMSWLDGYCFELVDVSR